MGQLQRIALHPVAQAQQPAREPLGRAVSGVAGDADPGHPQRRDGVAVRQDAQLGRAVAHGDQRVGVDDESPGRDLDQAQPLLERLVQQPLHPAEPLGPDRGDLGGSAVGLLLDLRGRTGEHEEQLPKRLAAVRHHVVDLERPLARESADLVSDASRQGVQETVAGRRGDDRPMRRHALDVPAPALVSFARYGAVQSGLPCPAREADRVLEPVTLRAGRLVLRPLAAADAAPIAAATRPFPDAFPYLGGAHPADDGYVEAALAARDAGTMLPFAVELDGRIVGSTRYGDIREANRGLEIGWTWYLPEVRGTAVNPAAKRALLAHAFERLEMLRVQLKCDARNLHSQRAIERLGAVREGVLRMHLRLPDGFQRDTVMYSIVAPEWPGVRARLDERLAGEGSQWT